MPIRSLTIGKRSTLGFGLIGLLVLFLGLFALNQMANMRNESKEVDENWLPSIMALSELNLTVMRIRANTLRLALAEESQMLWTEQRMVECAKITIPASLYIRDAYVRFIWSPR